MGTEAHGTTSTTLYFRKGASDKVYHAEIEPSGDGFVVNFAYGRRGSTLTTSTKTASPVAHDQAKKIFDKLVKEKAAKGYTPGEDGTPYQRTVNADRATGDLPQLLNAVEECDTQKYIANADWWAQEKFDGRRVMIRRVGDTIIASNRKGLVIDLPQPIVAYARLVGRQQWLIDGEAVGDTFYAFDALEHGGVDLRQDAYRRRLIALGKIVGANAGAPICAVETATSATAKQRMLGRLKGLNREGIVFKRHLGLHTPGRPASGGDWLKIKFTEMASCIVVGANAGKRSVAMELLDGDVRVSVGNVTIPGNSTIPAAGEIIEVRYLYAYPGGALFQPVYICRRDDLSVAACVTAQLKFKSGSGERDDN